MSRSGPDSKRVVGKLSSIGFQSGVMAFASNPQVEDGRRDFPSADTRPTGAHTADLWAALPEADRPIIGQIYVQRSSVGLASFHFTREECHISYESKDAVRFPSLDDGSRPPARKLFQHCRYDPKTRTFFGEVSWAPTTWDSEARREYEMIFADNFSAIKGGRIRYFALGGASMGEREFGVEVKYKRWQPPFPENVPPAELAAPVAPAASDGLISTHTGSRSPGPMQNSPVPVGSDRGLRGPDIDDPSSERGTQAGCCSMRRAGAVATWMVNPSCPPPCLEPRVRARA